MRGKRTVSFSTVSRMRIIPAHAGQTTRRSSCRPSPTDHPRACGANTVVECLTEIGHGSSPRMRGKHRWRVRRSLVLRIIPAHAGQTCMASHLLLRAADHPRACGANPMTAGEKFEAGGSSPRMRGKHIRILLEFDGEWIIPAHAGQTSAVSRADQMNKDHPRACGANKFDDEVWEREVGSSPRMRGKRTAM